MVKCARLRLVLLLAASLMFAQTVVSSGQASKPIQFEVAAIKPGDPKQAGSHSSSTRGGLFQMVNTPLKQWVEMGLSVKDYALKAPSWLETSRFDLNARVPTVLLNQKNTDGQDLKAEMMKALLVERFGLKWHEEMQSVSGFELVADKKVLLQPASVMERLEGTHGSGWGAALVQGTNMSMTEFAGLLGQVLGRPVVDATHLTGRFDIKLMWRPDSDATAAEWKRNGIDVDNLPDSASTAVQEQLGLRLQSAKVPTKVIVVDHINSQPTEN